MFQTFQRLQCLLHNIKTNLLLSHNFQMDEEGKYTQKRKKISMPCKQMRI